MAFERVMEIYVSDNEEYQCYREGMIPVLHSFGGSFDFDFEVSEVLLSKTDDAINRGFTIEFPSKEIIDEFFSNPEYLAVQKRHFVNLVASKTIISMHEKMYNYLLLIVRIKT